MITSKEVKDLVIKLGADLCGIASVDRFSGTPEGFRPTDIFKSCRSVISYGKRTPVSLVNSTTLIPYTEAGIIGMHEIDRIGLELSLHLEDNGTSSVLIPGNDPYEYWDTEKTEGRGIMSHKHAAQLAGLGVMGRSTLLINKKYGNMLLLGTLLVDAELEPDPVITESYCAPGCRRCIDSCPTKALDGVTANQKLCRQASIVVTKKGYVVKGCAECRKVCPNISGVKNTYK